MKKALPKTRKPLAPLTSGGGGGNLKTLSAAILAGCTIISCAPSGYAVDVQQIHPSELYKANQRACELSESVCADAKQPEDSKSVNADYFREGQISRHSEALAEESLAKRSFAFAQDDVGVNNNRLPRLTARNDANFATQSTSLRTNVKQSTNQPTGFAAPVILSASEESQQLLSNKPIDSPTLDYLKDNNIQIPQKGEYNSDTQTWTEGTPIQSPGSAYTTTVGTEENYSYSYSTADENGNLTTNYFSINLNKDLGSSDNITWTEHETYPSNYQQTVFIYEGNKTHYYEYNYSSPENYTEIKDQTISKSLSNPTGTGDNPTILEVGGVFNNPEGETNSVTNVLFQNNSTSANITKNNNNWVYVDIYGGTVVNKGNLTELTADFIENKTSTNGRYVFENKGGIIANFGTIGNITGDFIENRISGLDNDSGIIYNEGSINYINGNFVNNIAKNIIMNNNGTITGISSNFIDNDTGVNNNGIIKNITGNFIRNSFGITNKKVIGNITGDFINNSNTAITNSGTISDITGDFIWNGTAIDNRSELGSIGNITGNFIKNSSYAILNGGTINNINANFIETHIGLDNWGKINDITGSFSENHHNTTAGGINNTGYIHNVSATFVNNSSLGSETWGGAIFNRTNGRIDSINSLFFNNSATHGGAINNGYYNYGAVAAGGSIGTISGQFTNNKATVLGGAIYNNNGLIESIDKTKFDKNTSQYGGAIANAGTINEIKNSLFSKNETTEYETGGGAIYNDYYGSIGNISDTQFDGNSAGFAGAIYNDGQIGNITNSSFTNNTTHSYNNYQFGGGAIYNDYYGEIQDISGSFANNTAYLGGGIYNDGSIKDINASFVGNKVSYGFGGGLYNAGTINSITGEFKENSSLWIGGGIYNLGYINGDITANFDKNTSNAGGGAIHNITSTGNITKSSFNGNIGSYGGAIYNVGIIGDIDANFTNNTATSEEYGGGAIYNDNNIRAERPSTVTQEGNIGNITGNFTNNKALYAGALYNSGRMGNITGNFEKNTATSNIYGGGAIYNDHDGVMGNITGNFKNNSTKGAGGAVFNAGKIGFNEVIEPISTDTKNSGIINSTFTGNNASRGGAIYTSADLNIIADNGTTEFSGNYITLADGTKIKNAIYVDAYEQEEVAPATLDSNEAQGAVLTLETKNNGKIIVNDSIDGFPGYKLQLTGDTDSFISVNDDIRNADITHTNTTTYISEGKYLNNNNSLYLESGDININHMDTTPVHFYDFSLNSGNINLGTVDVNLEERKMGRFTADSYSNVTEDAKINVGGLNIVDTPLGFQKERVDVLFADKEIKDNVTSRTTEVPDGEHQLTAYTPIYKYDVNYDNRDDGGYFVFRRGGLYSGNSSDGFNPAILASPITTQAAGQSAMNETFRYVFEHADAFTQLPSLDRLSTINQNKYAIASTDYNQNMSYASTDLHNKGAWVRPYTSFESINLSNGPKVNTINYGTLVGFDSDFKTLKKGWTNVSTAYIGYNGSQISYPGSDTTMNGGLLGLTETFYKGNFWTALTATAGAGVAETRTMYGKEDSTMLMAGIGSKTGYNFEFKEGKYILQPIMFMSYTFVNTFDYTNAAGVKINSDPMHTIQLNPSVRFITNTKNNWQPYAQVGMVWNLLNETSATANGIKLPEMHTKPYIEYGVGLQKRIKDRFTAFGQAMVRNGGRNGIALTAGFRWALGSEGKPIEKVQDKTNILSKASETTSTTTSTRTVLKQLSPNQKSALIKQNNTTRTTMNATFKML